MNFFRPRDPNIVLFPKQLTETFCRQVISKFDLSKDSRPGHVFKGYAPEMKQSEDLMISNYDEWFEEDQVFSTALSNGLYKYMKRLSQNRIDYEHDYPLFDTGYQIQRTSPGGFYHWHPDACDSRYITFIFYLNDVKKGGYTEFIDGTRIRPRAGSLLFFPASFTYIHRGVAPVDQDKYICTGWLHRELSNDEKVLNSSSRFRELVQTEKDYQLLKEQTEAVNVGGHTPPEGDVALSYGQQDQNLILE